MLRSRTSGARIAVAVTVAALAPAALAACASPITATRLDGVVGPAFARLYYQQQAELGRVAPAPGPDGTAHCGRGGATSGRGAGDDWQCAVVYPFADGHLQPITYEVTVSATGCFAANGPTAVVGLQTMRTPDGRTVSNPLYAFDGCLDVG